MTHIHRIEVIDPTPVPITVSNSHEDLAEDQDWSSTAMAWPGDAFLYHHKRQQKTERPFAFTSKTREWFLDVEIRDLGKAYEGRRCFCTISDKNPLEKNSGQFAQSKLNYIQGSTAVFSFAFNEVGALGLWGEYEFAIHDEVRESGQSPATPAFVSPKILLELYYLSTPDLPEFFDDGVPLLFMRMFLLPMRHHMYTGPAVWVATMSKICFGSITPIRGRKCDTTKHWLVYNSIGGGSASFTTQWGGAGLNLEAWLDSYRNWIKYDVVTRVNCYDMAGILELVLCLGISHEQIHWEFHQPYGFIDAELVGWGRVNSPYLNGTGDKLLYENKSDPAREPFRNHAYLSWSTKSLSLSLYEQYNKSIENVSSHEEYALRAKEWESKNDIKMFMIDVCGGPHLGNQTRAEYESEIEVITNPAASFSKYVKEDYASHETRWKEQHHLGRGVTESTKDIPIDRENQFNTELNTVNENMPPPTSIQLMPDVENLLWQFERDISSASELQWKQCKKYRIRPYTTKDGTVVSELKYNFSMESTRMDRAASIRIATNNDPKTLRDAFARHLALRAVSIAGLDTVKTKGKISFDDSKTRVIGMHNMRAFIWCNVAVEIYIDDSTLWGKYDNALLLNVFTTLIRDPFAKKSH